MIRKQTSQEICLGEKKNNLFVFESSGFECSQCGFFRLQQLKPLFGVALDEDFYGEDFNALCTIKIEFKYGENVLVLKNTVYIFKYVVIIQLNQRVGKKWGGA